MTWNGENNTESVRYEMKKKLQYLRELLGVHCCGIFLPGNNIRPESKSDNNNNNNNNSNNNYNNNSGININ